MEDVRDALDEISDQFEPKRGLFGTIGDDKESVPIKTILDKATYHVRRTLAYRKFGTPEQLCGGPAVKYFAAYDHGGSDLGTDWWLITQAKLDEFLAEYPNALPDSDDRRGDRLRELDSKLCKIEDPAKYGQGLQQEIEDACRKWLAEWHDAETRLIAEREEQERAREKSALPGRVVSYFVNIDGFDAPRWHDEWGPAPLQPGCKAPDAMIIEALREWMSKNLRDCDFRLRLLSDERFAAIPAEAFPEGRRQSWLQWRERESDEEREKQVRELLGEARG